MEQQQKDIRLVTVTFTEPIQAQQLYAFRGAIAAKVGWQNEWFHNHDNTSGGYHHRYPILQYKRHQGKPMILCLEHGVEEIQKFFSQTS